MSRTAGGLTKWFKEDWRDVKTGKKCGRSGKEKKKRPYPACRPKAVASRISKQEAKKKTGPKKVKDIQSASGTFLIPINKATIAIAPHIALQA